MGIGYWLVADGGLAPVIGRLVGCVAAGAFYLAVLLADGRNVRRPLRRLWKTLARGRDRGAAVQQHQA